MKYWRPDLIGTFPEALIYKEGISLSRQVMPSGQALEWAAVWDPRNSSLLPALKGCGCWSQGHEGAIILWSTRNIRCSLWAALLGQFPADFVPLCYRYLLTVFFLPPGTVHKTLYFLIYNVRHSWCRTSCPQLFYLHFSSSPSPPSQEHVTEDPRAGPGQWKCVSTKRIHSFRLTALTIQKFIELHRHWIFFIWVRDCVLFGWLLVFNLQVPFNR